MIEHCRGLLAKEGRVMLATLRLDYPGAMVATYLEDAVDICTLDSSLILTAIRESMVERKLKCSREL